jgi:hypothetical protein
MQDKNDRMTRVSLKYAAILTAIVTVLFFTIGQADAAKGFLIGALLSLFSMSSLIFLVPFLFVPGNHAAKGLLSATLFMKLPLYGILLYLAVIMLKTASFALVMGIAVVPMVLTGCAIRNAFREAAAENALEREKAAQKAARRAAARSEAQALAAEVEARQQKNSQVATRHAQTVHAQAHFHAPAVPVREGV